MHRWSAGRICECDGQAAYLVWLPCKHKGGLHILSHALPGLALGNAQLEGHVFHAVLHILDIPVEGGD